VLAVVLALGASLAYGLADFAGGIKSRSLPVLSVVLLTHGTALAVIALVVTGAALTGAALPDGDHVAYAGVAGLAEAVAVVALYRGLAVGTMSIVAPVSAVAPGFAVVAAAVLGELPGAGQGAGIALAAVGIVLISLDRSGSDAGRAAGASVAYGLATALGFAAFLIAMDGASEGGVAWALLVARLTSVAVLAAVFLARRQPFAIPARELPAVGAIGLLVLAADGLYGLASTEGLLSVVAVLSSLYPVVTIALARVYLHERLRGLQQVGVAITLCGAAVISVG
jgi:drug/metabolite transporter (DMT)-like permease